MKKLYPSLYNSLRFQFSIIFFVVIVFSCSIYSQTTLPFPYTGSTQTFTVPCGVFNVNVKAWGGGGSGGGSDTYIGAPGGGGGFVQTDIAVTPGQILTIIVGGGGGPGGNCAGSAPGGTGGWGNGVIAGGRGGNAGASGCSGGGGAGGGASAVYDGGTALLVAGGGGGGSGGGNTSAGGAGGASGNNGNTGSGCSVGIAGASSNGVGSPGGDRGGADGAGGGGGGGGYNGGTSGGAPPGCDCGGCGGGGGNSYSSGTNIVITNGSGQSAGNSADPDLPSGGAVGGYYSAGGDGFMLLTFNEGPFAGFTSTTVCNGNGTQFTNSSTTDVGIITSTSWDFGDGSPLNTDTNPLYTYPLGGTYQVTLIVNNSLGCADTLIDSVQVYYNPIAGFGYNDVCLGDSMHFVNASVIDNSTSIASYLWSFGDGSPTSSLESPAHLYTAGVFSVLLLATSADGCMDTASANVKTFDAPTSLFTFSNTCLFDSAKFTNTSLNPILGNTASWSWGFGDGSPVNTTVWNLSHLYSTPGNYQITLITYSSNLGCADTLKDSITVFPMPVANFSFTNVCLNEPLIFNDLSSVATGSIVGWSWSFGDGTPISTAQDTSHVYASPGTYSVSLIVTTNNSCKDTIVKSVVVHPLPTALYSSINVCDGSTVQFDNLSVIASTDSIQSWTWDFGDGSPLSTNQNTSHLYSAAGSYAVQLLVVSNFGCLDSITKTTVVNPNPTVLFSASDTIGCEPLCINFQNLSMIATGTNNSMVWDLGDGSAVNNGENPSNCYNNNSTYSPVTFDITLTVTSDSGCVSTLTKINYITVNPNPIAVFTVSPNSTTLINPVISFKDFSVGADSWSWDFGDLQLSSSSTPAPHTYGDTGTYLITLITSTQYGCADTAYETVFVDADFVFYIPNSFTPDGDGINDNFTGKGLFIKEFKMSIFDRWGNLIFLSDDINKPWNGKANHGPDIALQDVYVYVIEVKDIRNKIHSYKGKVSIVK